MSFHKSATCPRKAKARRETIINIYRELFQDSLPMDKQYWTLAGPCFDEEGKLGDHSEINQLVESKLITLDQYHGIDNGEEIIQKNREAIPTANFYHGDFVTTLRKESMKPTFQPGIIHADYTRLKERVVTDTGNIIYILHKANVEDVMVVMNFPWNNPYSGRFQGTINPRDVIDLLGKNQRFNIAWDESWNIYPKFYYYGGTGDRSKTTMMTIILYRKIKK